MVVVGILSMHRGSNLAACFRYSSAQIQNKELSETNAKFVGVLETYKSDLEEIKHDVTDIKTHLNKE